MPAPSDRGTSPVLDVQNVLSVFYLRFVYFRFFLIPRFKKKLDGLEPALQRCSGLTSKPMRGSLPVSRDLVRIVKESSRLENPGASLDEHLRAVEERQAKSTEFYLRACALRLEQGT